MERVSTVMPIAVKSGRALFNMEDASSNAGAAEDRAAAVEAQSARAAENTLRQAREKGGAMREKAQEKTARAHVSAANSGLEVSGSPLLSLESIEHADDKAEGQLYNDAAVNAQGILDSGEAQAQSIRLSARNALRRSLFNNAASLLDQGGSALDF